MTEASSCISVVLGDGVNRLPELIRTEQVPLKLVYATVEYTNNSSETIYDAGYVNIR